MNVKTVQKIVSIIMISMMLISFVNTIVFAVPSPNQITATSPKETKTITDAGKQIVGILQTVGVVLSVVILTVIGIKYMMGSAEEKAEYKKTFMPYIIGAALIFAASVFAQVAYDFFTGLGDTATAAGK